MKKTRILVGFITLLCALATTTTPANAFFEAKTAGATKGPISKFPATTTFEYDKNGAVTAIVKCEVGTGTSKATGFWTIQNSEETSKAEPPEQTQPATKVGPHESITIQKWGECKATVGTLVEPFSLKECRLQVAQPAKNTAAGQKALGSVQTTCTIETITAPKCTITIAQEAANHGLDTTLLTNGVDGNGVEIKINITQKPHGIQANANAICQAVGIPAKTTEATFKTGEHGSEAIVTFGQQLI